MTTGEFMREEEWQLGKLLYKWSHVIYFSSNHNLILPIYFYNRYPVRCSLDYQNCYTSISGPNSNKNSFLSCLRSKWAEMIRFSIMWDISMKTEYLKWNIVIHNRLRGSARFRKSTVELSTQKAAMHVSPSPVLLQNERNEAHRLLI